MEDFVSSAAEIAIVDRQTDFATSGFIELLEGGIELKRIVEGDSE